jgi:energy-coupling factor transporter ATP-binding protein EcfA2
VSELERNIPACPEPEVQVTPPDREGRVGVRLQLGAEVYVDRCNPTSSKSRNSLLDKFAERFPFLRDLQCRDELERQIMNAAATVFMPMPAETAGGERVNVERIVQVLQEEGIEFFHDENDGDIASFLSFVDGAHRENYTLYGTASKRKIRSISWKKLRHSIGEQQMNDLLGTLDMKAVYEGEQHRASIRSALIDGRVYVDLGNDDWEVAVVDESGWVLVDSTDVPVRFVRPKGLKSLPNPTRDADLGLLKRFINVPEREQRLLCLAWMLAALRTSKTYTVLVVIGESGSAKSSTCEVLRRLVDPNKGNLRIKPRNVEDLYTSAINSHMVTFENVSVISDEMSDALCAITTGSAQAKRQLYSDHEESFAEAHRPVMINGINNPVTRPDLSSRTILVSLSRISNEDRVHKERFDVEFEAAYPALFGALLTLLANTLREEARLEELALPRTADYCRLGVAMERALGLADGTFLEAFEANQAGSHWTSISASTIGPVLLRLMDEARAWSGTAEELRVELKRRLGREDRYRRAHFPTTPSALSHALRLLAPSLRAVGMCVEYDIATDRKRTRLISFSWDDGGPSDRPDGADGDLQSLGGRADPPLQAPGTSGSSREASCSRPRGAEAARPDGLLSEVEELGRPEEMDEQSPERRGGEGRQRPKTNRGGQSPPPKLCKSPSAASAPSDEEVGQLRELSCEARVSGDGSERGAS